MTLKASRNANQRLGGGKGQGGRWWWRTHGMVPLGPNGSVRFEPVLPPTSFVPPSTGRNQGAARGPGGCPKISDLGRVRSGRRGVGKWCRKRRTKNKKKLLLEKKMERPEYKKRRKRKRLEQSLLRHRSVCRVSSVSTPRQGSPGSGAPHGTADRRGARRQDACQARARAQGRSGPPSGLTICLMAGAGGKGKFRSASLGVVGPLHPPHG